MKKCKECKKIKKDDCFYGGQGECKECTKIRVQKNYRKNIEYYKTYDQTRHRHSIDRLIRHRYAGMKTRVNGNNSHKSSVEGKAILSQSEFLEWCYKKENITILLKLHEDWRKSNYSNKIAPSIDRIDNDKGYVIGNLQWITLSKNTGKYQKETKKYKENFGRV